MSTEPTSDDPTVQDVKAAQAVTKGKEPGEARVYQLALRRTVVGLAVLAVLAVVVGALVAGGRGVTAALVGVAVAALAGLTTQAAMSWGHKRSADQMTMAIGGSWLLKMFLIVIALFLLQRVEGFHKELFAAFAVVGVLLTLAVDFWVISKSRVPYVAPSSKTTAS